MAFEQKDGTGALFQNQRKTNDRQPDFQGSALFEGQELDIAGWKKRSQAGKEFISISVKPKQKKESDNDLPF